MGDAPRKPLRTWLGLAVVAGLSTAPLALHAILAGAPVQEANPGYRFPWAEGDSHRCVQGNRTWATHRGDHATAWDFWMWPGTVVRTSRAGVVEHVRSDAGEWPGWYDGNYVSVRHDDDSVAIYAHLGGRDVRVAPGDAVEAGAPLARSGLSGRTLYPHLHFVVRDGAGEPLAVAFDGEGGPVVPTMWHSFTAPRPH